MIADQLIAPTCAHHLAKQLLVIALKCHECKLPRVVHATCNGYTTPIKLAEFLRQKFNGKATIIRLPMKSAMAELGQRAKRPRNGILDNCVLRSAGIDVMPAWDKVSHNFT
jgi:dTDP-4-dehydrorhamnose reductase